MAVIVLIFILVTGLLPSFLGGADMGAELIWVSTEDVGNGGQLFFSGWFLEFRGLAMLVQEVVVDLSCMNNIWISCNVAHTPCTWRSHSLSNSFSLSLFRLRLASLALYTSRAAIGELG